MSAPEVSVLKVQAAMSWGPAPSGRREAGSPWESDPAPEARPAADGAFHPAIAGALLRWYDEHARDLPWRRTSDPYAIMVSEFMLQQTQVKTVIPYYRTFLERFPTFAALAEAPLEAVLEAWKGLGYYRRARNLHAAAKTIVERFGGAAPADWDAFRSLPGVGDYTAAAVLSIAFGKPYPAVDGNVIRVGARLLAAEEPADSPRLRRRIAEGLRAIIPRDRPGDFNQALMELGATVCAVPAPDCGRCPLAGFCSAKTAGKAARLPLPARRTKGKEERYYVLVLRLGNSTLLSRRPEEGLLAGLWEFPRAAAHGDGEKGAPASLPELDGVLNGRLAARRIEHVGAIDHKFSHLTWRLDVLRVEVETARPPAAVLSAASEDAREAFAGGAGASYKWVPDRAVDDMALSKAMQKAWELVKAYESLRESARRP